MPLDKQHYIHSRAGRLNVADLTTPADLDSIVQAIANTANGNLVVHSHGGLVSAPSGMQIAERLLPVYADGGHPLFFIWESGAWETIRNNITELAHEPVFRQLLRKALEYALGRLGGSNGSRSILPGAVDAAKVRATLDAFTADPSLATIPYRGFVPVLDDAHARSAGVHIDLDEIEADLEEDDEFRRALATLPDLEPGSRSALLPAGTAEVRRTPFSLAASEVLSEKPGTRGLVTFLQAAKVLVRVLKGVLSRYADHRDHGLYATVVEELIRTMKVGGSGLNEWGKALQWNRMKKDCSDAFGTDPLCAGSAFMKRLAQGFPDGTTPGRITLIGHSTGAIYICDWLEAADRLLPKDWKFDVVFLAPAVTYARFAEAIEKHGHRIGNFRLFALKDQLELDDQVWGSDESLGDAKDWRRFLYPSSLLYLVSGILESRAESDGTLVDEPDMPLVGMERYFARTGVYTDAAFPEVAKVRNWMKAKTHGAVWSVTAGEPPGCNSACNDHGGFDNEPATLESLRHIVKVGF